MTDENPDRLHDASDDAELRALLRAGRHELPDDRDLAGVLAKLGPVIGGGPPGGGGAPVAKTAAATKGAWVGTAKVIAVALGLGAVWSVHQLSTRTARPVDAVAAVPSPSSPPAPPPEASTPIVVSPEPVAPVPSIALSTPKPSASNVSSNAVDPNAELRLIERAEDALATDPATSLRLTDESARRFPKGDNRQEAEVIAITALLVLHRRPEAEARAAAFRASYPKSTHLRRIDTLFAQHP